MIFFSNINGVVLTCNSNLLQPHFRRPFFNAPQFTWSVEWITFGDGFHYFFYILRKVSIEYGLQSFNCLGGIYDSEALYKNFLYICQGKRSSADEELSQSHDKPLVPTISMFHEELEGEDYIFRTNIDEMD